MKIYTRKGDAGETALFGGARVPKNDIRVEAYGTVDELNSALGLAASALPDSMDEWRARLQAVQADCFTLGAILATPDIGEAKPKHIPDLPDSRVTQLEEWIDQLDEEVEPLRAFVLPGGSESAAMLHQARSICRRAERRVVALTQMQQLDTIVLRYLNRLSDFLFAIARAANARQGVPDVEWHPESTS